MKMELGDDKFVLLHDNRLFLFRSRKALIKARERHQDDVGMASLNPLPDAVASPMTWSVDTASEWVGNLFEGESEYRSSCMEEPP